MRVLSWASSFHEKAGPGQEFFCFFGGFFHFSVQSSRLCRHPSIRTLTVSDFRPILLLGQNTK